MHLALIPKKHNLDDHISDVSLISLCNIVYKLISKVIANKLNVWLLSIIAANQTNFVSGHQIMDNILRTFEIFPDMNL